MDEDRSNVSVSLSRRAKFLLAGLLIGFLAGILCVLVIQNLNPKDEADSAGNVSVVFERIVAQNELVSVSQDYSIVEKAADRNRLFDIVDIPFTENSFWYRYAGTIKAGVSLEAADLTTNGQTITVSLSNPYIISNTPDMETTGVLEENSNILNPIEVKDVDAMLADCKARSEEEAVAGGLLEEAQVETERNLRNLFFAALGDAYTVEFNWVGEPATESGQ